MGFVISICTGRRRLWQSSLPGGSARDGCHYMAIEELPAGTKLGCAFSHFPAAVVKHAILFGIQLGKLSRRVPSENLTFSQLSSRGRTAEVSITSHGSFKISLPMNISLIPDIKRKSPARSLGNFTNSVPLPMLTEVLNAERISVASIVLETPAASFGRRCEFPLIRLSAYKSSITRRVRLLTACVTIVTRVARRSLGVATSFRTLSIFAFAARLINGVTVAGARRCQ